MTFAWPHLLWLIAVPIALFVWELLGRNRGAAETTHPKILRAEISTHELTVTREPARLSRRRIRPWLALGLTFAVVALARPQWGRVDEPVFDQSREIIIAIDLSRSMNSPDVKPSRLDRAKLLVQALLEKLQGERVGLVVFSGTAFLQSPLSSDYEILREFLPALNPDFLPEGGTNYRAMIENAIEAFGSGTAADRFLVVLSDGEATDDTWQAAADKLRDKGIRVIALGVGTAAGSMIPDGSGGLVKDERGAVVLSKLESGTLEQLAQQTRGVYRDASTWLDLAALIDETVNAGKKGDFVDKNSVRLVERFQWPLAFALWCLLVSAYYEVPVRPRTRDLALRGRKPMPDPRKPAATAMAVALIGLTGLAALVSPIPLEAAVKTAAIPPPSSAAEASGTSASMGKIVSRLANKPALSGPDLSEFAHETLNWGRRLKEGGQRVPAGPVHDALDAVERLIASGEKLANWEQLRSDLQALLDESEKPKPPQNQKQNEPQQSDKSQQNPKPNQSNPSPKTPNSPPEKNEQKSHQQKQPPDEKQPSGDSKQNAGSPSQSKPQENADQSPAFGDMKQPAPPPQPKPQPQEMQKVGGTKEKKDAPPADAALAVPMEKLDQLRNQDSPAQLFQMMQSDRSHGKQSQKGKNW